MDAYTGFAYVYDEYMDNIPYEEWGQYMIALLKENGVSGDSSVLESVSYTHLTLPTIA